MANRQVWLGHSISAVVYRGVKIAITGCKGQCKWKWQSRSSQSMSSLWSPPPPKGTSGQQPLIERGIYNSYDRNVYRSITQCLLITWQLNYWWSSTLCRWQEHIAIRLQIVDKSHYSEENCNYWTLDPIEPLTSELSIAIQGAQCKRSFQLVWANSRVVFINYGKKKREDTDQREIRGIGMFQAQTKTFCICNRKFWTILTLPSFLKWYHANGTFTTRNNEVDHYNINKWHWSFSFS